MDGACGHHAGHVEPDPDLSRHHRHSWAARLTELARAVRSKLLALREEDYVLAAQLMGAGSGRIIGRHLVPGFMSHLIATATLAIPGMILGETALSFLRPWASPANHQLGHSFDRSPQRQRHCFLSLAVVSNHSGHSRDSRVQLPGRRAAGCCRSVQVKWIPICVRITPSGDWQRHGDKGLRS